MEILFIIQTAILGMLYEIVYAGRIGQAEIIHWQQ
jgi:hypothetical protein